MRRLYLDDNATTAMASEVVEVMEHALYCIHGNASSIHKEGVEARLALERARRGIERSLGAPRDSLVFTGGGTESNSLGIRGALGQDAGPAHVVTSRVEHKVVVETLAELLGSGRIDLHHVPTDQWGSVHPQDLARTLRPDTRLVVLMLANNEVGALSPIAELARVVRTHSPRAHLHVDAVQAAGRVPMTVSALGADTVAIAAHKFRGPKGVGGLFVAPGTTISPVQLGGGQERHLRAGTENIAGAVGMAKALELAVADLEGRSARLVELREALWKGLLWADERFLRNSAEHDCLPGTLNVSLPGADGRTLVRMLDETGYAVSAGSACTSTGESTSHVLEALHADDPARVRGAVRISFAWPRDLTMLRGFAADFGNIAKGLLPP